MLYHTDCQAPGPMKDGKAVRVPLPNASLKQATSFLEFVYHQEGLSMSLDAVSDIVGLLHRFDCRAAMQRLQLYLKIRAGYSSSHPNSAWVNPDMHWQLALVHS